MRLLLGGGRSTRLRRRLDNIILPDWGIHGKIERIRRTLLPRMNVDVSGSAPVSVGLLQAWRQEPRFLQLWLQMRSGSEGTKTVTDTVVATDAITIATAGLGNDSLCGRARYRTQGTNCPVRNGPSAVGI